MDPMAVSKRLRFEVLRRDNHACRYCGAIAPDARLTVDHVVPTALGGSDYPDNLVAACSACNSGKSSIDPDAETVADVAGDALRWRRAMELANEVASKEAAVREAFRKEFWDYWHRWTYSVTKMQDGKLVEIRVPWDVPGNWEIALSDLQNAGLTIPDMRLAVDTAMSARYVKDEFSYFIGVCRRKISERQAVAQELIRRGLV